MKQLLLLVLLSIAKLSFADSLDEMRIYVNHKLVAVSSEGGSQLLELNVSEGDTLTFELSTDWGGEEKATLNIFDHISSEQVFQLKHLSGKPGTYEQIVKQELMDSELLYVLNFNIKSVGVWKFARIILKEK